jgi:putative component of toxin-antitoxin plasmid stabilization module
MQHGSLLVVLLAGGDTQDAGIKRTIEMVKE